MLYLMVGGPCHGEWRQVDPDSIRASGFVSVPRHVPMVFDEASEFGVPRSLHEVREDRYRLQWFELHSTGRDEAYIGALVWMGMAWAEVGAIVGDAFHAACDPSYVPGWSMPRR